MRSIVAANYPNLLSPGGSSCSNLLNFLRLFFLLVSVIVLLPLGRARGSCIPTTEEARILMEFKAGVADSFNHLSSWTNVSCPHEINSESYPCSNATSPWIGVTCGNRHGRVLYLTLPNMGLRGPISASLGQLRFLRFFNLSYNNFSGSLPPQISNCTHLEAFDLTQNSLTGSIPSEWSGLRKLQLIEIQGNALTGTIPASLTNCSALRGIILSQNQLSGGISPELSRLSNLAWLDLSLNPRISGTIPATLANCSSLKEINFEANGLSGDIPPELGMLKALQVLLLLDNSLRGGIPSVLANCTAFQQLGLEDNNLSGNIPQELGMLNQLVFFRVNGNNLTGDIPSTLGNFSALSVLDVHSNGLSGSIPAALGMLTALWILSVWGNSLTGNVPATLGNCSSLIFLYMDLNQLSNSIPQELGMLDQLHRLSIHSNHLTGSVPTTLANCSALQMLDFDSNFLSGSIPFQLGMLKDLSWVSIAGNRLTGNFPERGTAMAANWSALQYLDLSHNQLTGTLDEVFNGNLFNGTALYNLNLNANNFRGELPADGFVRFSKLQRLDLGHNSLSGTLPAAAAESLTDLTHVRLQGNRFEGSISNAFVASLQLQELDLSSNNLSGAIPASFGDLRGVLLLNLSYNSLSGSIPSLGSQLLQLQRLILSNNHLSGNIPASLSACVQLLTLNLARNQLSGNIPPNLGELRSLTVLDLSYNKLQGLVPDIAPFNNERVTHLAGNIGLCGRVVNKPCATNPPINSDQSPYKRAANRSKIIILVVGAVIIGTILLVLAAKGYCSKQLNKSTSSPISITAAGTPLLHLSADELRQATEGFSEENVLGRGSVGTVYRAILQGGKAVAVKLLNKEMALADEAAFRREVNIMGKVRHRNVLRVWGCCFNLDLKAIILELMPNGSLDKHLHARSTIAAAAAELSGAQKLKILREVAQGLEYLHHRHPEGSIVHCDIKPANILLDENFEARIADFGIAKVIKGRSIQESASILLRGSVGYIAPEYAYKAEPSTEGDVYSFGVVMLEVLTGKRPTCSEISEEAGDTFLSWVRSASTNPLTILNAPGLSSNITSKLFELALSCTQDSPANRPTMLHICHIFMDLCDTTREYPNLLLHEVEVNPICHEVEVNPICHSV